MGTISEVGNLCEAPKLREGESGSYCYARVAVSTRSRDESGTWVDDGTVFYTLVVRGVQAENLCAMAKVSGNIPVTFTGTLSAHVYTTKSGEERVEQRVFCSEVGVSLRVPARVSFKQRGQRAAMRRESQRDTEAATNPTPIVEDTTSSSETTTGREPVVGVIDWEDAPLPEPL